MFSAEGKPRTNTGPGYRTLVIHTKDGAAKAVGELSYLAVPQDHGFLFLGESSVSLHEPENPKDVNALDEPRPHDYDATEVWTAQKEVAA